MRSKQYKNIIINILKKSDKWLSTREVSYLCNINWITTRKYLNTLHKEGKVEIMKLSWNKIYWKTKVLK